MRANKNELGVVAHDKVDLFLKEPVLINKSLFGRNDISIHVKLKQSQRGFLNLEARVSFSQFLSLLRVMNLCRGSLREIFIDLNLLWNGLLCSGNIHSWESSIWLLIHGQEGRVHHRKIISSLLCCGKGHLAHEQKSSANNVWGTGSSLTKQVLPNYIHHI